jgi:hypothetical protein
MPLLLVPNSRQGCKSLSPLPREQPFLVRRHENTILVPSLRSVPGE